MTNDKLAELIAKKRWDDFYIHIDVINALADELEAESKICDYCGEEEDSCPGLISIGHRWRWEQFNRAKWVAKAKGGSC